MSNLRLPTIQRLHLQTREIEQGVLLIELVDESGARGSAATVARTGVAEAIGRLATRAGETSLLAFELRWRRWGRAALTDPVDRLASGAFELACAELASAMLGVPLAALVGGTARATGGEFPTAGETLDLDTLDIAAFVDTGLRTDATGVKADLASCGGIAGLRRIAAVARALNLEVELRAGTETAVERRHAAELAAAFGFRGSRQRLQLEQGPPSRVRRIRLRRIALPLKQVYVSAMYLTDRVQRTIVEVETDDGITGIGETGGSDEIFQLVTRLGKGLVGCDALDRRGFARRFANVTYENRNGRSGWQALGGLELACWDVAGKRLEVPLADLLGRADPADSVRAVCLLPAAKLDRIVAREELDGHFAHLENTKSVVEYALAMRERYGFDCFKYKSAGLNPQWDLALLGGLREALGANAEVRFDPNAAYETATATALCRALEPLGLEYYEDPTDGIEGLARLRSAVTRPVASNMVLIQFDQFAPTVRRRAIDVLLADLFHWGGVENFRDMAAAAEAFGLDTAIHSFYESGIATVANIHLALGLGLTRHANDQGHHDLAADVLGSGVLEIERGRMKLLPGPGLGVTLDETRMRELTMDEGVVQ
jgi:glucarate dehydratase